MKCGTHIVVVGSVGGEEVADHSGDGVDLVEEVHLLLPHARELQQEREVLRQVLALGARSSFSLQGNEGQCNKGEKTTSFHTNQRRVVEKKIRTLDGTHDGEHFLYEARDAGVRADLRVVGVFIIAAEQELMLQLSFLLNQFLIVSLILNMTYLS